MCSMNKENNELHDPHTPANAVYHITLIGMWNASTLLPAILLPPSS